MIYNNQLIHLFTFFLLLIVNQNFGNDSTNSEFNRADLNPEESFFQAVPQQTDKRRVVSQLTLLQTVNLSEQYEVYNAYQLASNSENITLFDQSNFRFLQFDFELNKINQFGNQGRGPGEFVHPLSLSVDSDGSYWTYDGRLNRVNKWTPDGRLSSELSLPFGVRPQRFAPMDSNHFGVLSLMSKNLFSIIGTEGNVINSFGHFDYDLSFTQRGLLTDGRLTATSDMLIYAGYRNDLIKAYTKDKELIYSRKILDPLEYDLFNADREELNSAIAVIQLVAYKDYLVTLYFGNRTDPNSGQYLDIYDIHTGDYIMTYSLDVRTRLISISTPNDSAPLLIARKADQETRDMLLSIYELPF